MGVSFVTHVYLVGAVFFVTTLRARALIADFIFRTIKTTLFVTRSLFIIVISIGALCYFVVRM